MNINETIQEIGILETMRIVSKYDDCIGKTSAYLPPVSNQFIEERIQALTASIVSTSKKSLFMMMPEIAILECLSQMRWSGTAILAIPQDMNADSKKRVYENIPPGIYSVIFVNEGSYPNPIMFRPDNGIILCTGISPNSYRQYLMPSSCRMMSLYKAFQGERILLSCFPYGTKVPEIGWSYTDRDFFTQIIEGRSS